MADGQDPKEILRWIKLAKDPPKLTYRRTRAPARKVVREPKRLRQDVRDPSNTTHDGADQTISGTGLTDHMYDADEFDAISEQTPVDPTFTESSIVVSVIERYVTNLRLAAGVKSFRDVFVCQQHRADGSLIANRFTVILPMPRTFTNGPGVVFGCTCNKPDMDILIHTPLQIPHRSEDFHQTLDARCSHVEALQAYFNDDVPVVSTPAGSEYQEDMVVDVEYSDVKLVFSDGTYAVTYGGKCLTCTCTRTCCGCHSGVVCKHLKLLDQESKHPTSAAKMRCLSKVKIPPIITATQRETFRKPLATYSAVCSCIVKLQKASEKKIVTRCSTSVVTVESMACCGEEFDGCEEGLVHMSTHLIGYDVMWAYLHQFVQGKAPLNSFYQVLKKDLQVLYDMKLTISYSNFKDGWFSFLDLLDLDVPSGFLCRICDTTPRMVLCDGTSLAFRVALSCWRDGFSKTTPSKVRPAHQSRFEERVILPSAEARRRLLKWAESPATEEVFNSMLIVVGNCSPSVVLDFLQYATKQENDLWHMKTEFRRMVKDLASPYPASGLMTPSTSSADLINDLKRETQLSSNVALLKRVQHWYPCLYSLLTSLAIDKLPHVLIDLLHHIYTKAMAPFIHAETVFEDIGEGEDGHLPVLRVFPGLPDQRRRPHYSIDGNQNPSKVTQDCSKYHRLLPGIFTVYCEHGVCYGFEVMRSSEGENVPFTILLTLFEQAPEYVIYDNACNLHRYAMNREPSYFQKTKFMVDRFHWHNHISCSSGYELDAYPQWTTINSQVNEQMNSSLARLKPSLSFMGQDTFLKSCTLFLYMVNQDKQVSLRQKADAALSSGDKPGRSLK